MELGLWVKLKLNSDVFNIFSLQSNLLKPDIYGFQTLLCVSYTGARNTDIEALPLTFCIGTSKGGTQESTF